MSASFRCLSVLSLVFLAQTSFASEILVETSVGFGQVGGFCGLCDPAHMPQAGYQPALTPDNDPTFQNYFMGRSTFGSPATGMASPERRAFFMFDMVGVLATFDPSLTGPGAPPIVDPYEYEFEVTDVDSGTGSTRAGPVLTIPEPGAFWLFVLALAAAGRRGRRR